MTKEAREAIRLRILNADETGVQLAPGTYIDNADIEEKILI